MTNTSIFPISNIKTVTLMLICAIKRLFVLENPNCAKPTQIILVFKKQSPRQSAYFKLRSKSIF